MEERKKIKPSLTKEEKRLLRIKESIKLKKPKFTRMNYWLLNRIDEDIWRKPRGLDNKIRLERKGFPSKVKVGYRKPRPVRGLHPSGFKEVIVHNVADLELIDPAREAIRIASTVGARKREQILERAKALGIKVLNPG
ncbi:MAG: 50S ribosomal protein L32e [Thermoprotei archaeon]|nr:MAG: 50S ribosomal protein L32e [Thermoprotei archaeon]RLE89337.1 MAG: 50S ribosomal protein L32e [Thermoprotei archaeon]